ncbi:basic form of pathogenesis-related protein 1-like [Benincasa hispida]|uniref:basic form of pathogenesis-related protein 1-like n=1 Tax=Benincasa hispida TaxID=102211 RepID=UPI001901E5C6|nr:basic form of pathogenesis-related protein 1-like [Benincasa hispida]XP_038888868.1 basic form of pathogenesis-related protein 1-like [Benincasa hispida]
MASSIISLFAFCCVGLSLILAPISPTVAKSSPQDFVDAHNAIRAEYGVGPVTWNKTLAEYAQKYAETRIATCEMEHSMGPYGENLAEAFETTTAELTVNYWASEKKFYNHQANKCVEEECGHFLQVVWKDTTSIGCAEVKCNNNYIFTICNYYPPGGYPDQLPY